MKAVLASSNNGKLRELAAILSPLGYELVTQSSLGIDTPPETGVTSAENALLKVRFAARLSGLPAIADDSGIEVDALGGRPGVFSARYSGEGATDAANVQKMLSELRGVPPERRLARYRCVIAFARTGDDPSPLIANGTWEGHILDQPRGVGGFGYDPIFQPAGLDVSAAELSAAQKNARSHRGEALRELARLLRKP